MTSIRLLLNGTLGKPFYSYHDDNKLITAAGWAPWWLESEVGDPSWKNKPPVFSPTTLDDSLTQQVSTPFGTHVAGLWQQVPSATGNSYELTVEGQAWSSEDVSPASKLEASDVNLQIGIDPTGGLDPNSPLIQWSNPSEPLTHWQTLHLEITAEASIITIYLKSAPTLPKRQQSVFWRQAMLRPIGRHKRGVNIVGTGDTHIHFEPERPKPGEPVTAVISSTRDHAYIDLLLTRPDQKQTAVIFRGKTLDIDRHVWRYEFKTDLDGLYEARFVGDKGARLLALRLMRAADDVQLVPSDKSRFNYRRVYVLLPPTTDMKWLLAAARGGYSGRYTIGFSADDAGIGDLEARHVLAVNPHHWPEVLTASWFQQHYPGVKFTPLVANQPEDLEAWLKDWTGIE
ncbi:MAG: hypothetical protein GY796_11065 [Chloroflexi bacterium]|nr:hypothetical protein [Chloroflexota bacterium]